MGSEQEPSERSIPPRNSAIRRARRLQNLTAKYAGRPSSSLLPTFPSVLTTALIFRGIGFFDVGVMVFTRQLDKLATFIVPCGPKQARRSHDEWVALLRHRLGPAKRKAEASRESAQR